MSSGDKKSPRKEELIQDKIVAGTKRCPYKLAVVGGGPSGCSVIIRAFRIGFGGELCGFCTRKPAVDKEGKNILADAQFPFQSAGVCLIDQGTTERLGGGKLQDYIINANTWANKFVTNVMDDKPDVVPQETVTGTPFQKLGAAPNAVTLRGFGCKPAPLPMVGAFLRDAGAVVADVLNNHYPESSRCLVETSVTAMQQVMLPVPAQYEQDLPEKNSSLGTCVGWKLSLSQKCAGAPGGKLIRDIYAHKVVLATGGRQELPRLPNPAHNRKLLSSDYVCTQRGLDELRSRLVKAGASGAASRTTAGRVVIIGGSHSSFSVAWLCLHRLNDLANPVASTPATESKQDEANNVSLGQSGVCMIHKSSIKVFYPTKADADRDGYVIESAGMATGAPNTPGAGQGHVSKSWIRGQIHPFGGLRGDAKELWRSIRDGRETRVKLIQVRQNVTTVPPGSTGLAANAQPVKQQAIVEKLFDEAVVIVWACGYNTNLSMPVLDLHGVPVAMKVKCGQVEVDDHARVLSASPTVGVYSAGAPVAATPVVAAVATSEVTPDEPTLRSVLAELGGVDSSDEEGTDEVKTGGSTPNAPTESPVRSRSATSSPQSRSAKSVSEVVSAVAARSVATPVSALPVVPPSPAAPLAPAPWVASPPLALRSVKTIAAPVQPPVIEGLLGSGLGFGLQALLESGLPDGSSGRADGVAVYLKRGATLVLAQVLGSRVFGGGDIRTWEDRLKIIKKMQIVAKCDAATAATTNGPGVSTSLDAGQSLLGSPTNKRPSTTAGVRASSSGCGLASPAGPSGKVFNRLSASRQTPTEKASPKTGNSSGATPSKLAVGTKAFTFPDVQYDGVTSKPGAGPAAKQVEASTPVRPITASSAISPTSGAASPKSPTKVAAAFVPHSPEAQRCADLVNKVAALNGGLEQLQLQGAREFLAVPTLASPLAGTAVVPNLAVLSVSTPGSAVPSKSQSRALSPAAVPRSGSASKGLAEVVPATTAAKPPIHGRAASSGRAGGVASQRPGRSTADPASILVPKPTSSARVMLTPLSTELQKRAASGGSSCGSASPRKASSSGSSGGSGSARSSSSTPRGSRVVSGKAPAPGGATPAPGTQPTAVLRSNSLTNQAALLRVSSGTVTITTTQRVSVPDGKSINKRIVPGAVGAGHVAAQAKNAKLELPSIPQHKRSQNQDGAAAMTATAAVAVVVGGGGGHQQ